MGCCSSSDNSATSSKEIHKGTETGTSSFDSDSGVTDCWQESAWADERKIHPSKRDDHNSINGNVLHLDEGSNMFILK